MESFFALLQNNVLDRRTWPTRNELRTAIVTWIERTYQLHARTCAHERASAAVPKGVASRRSGPPSSQSGWYSHPTGVFEYQPLDC